MANINLLPWREELRQERNQEFYTILVGVLIIAAGIAFLWKNSVDSDIADQRAINSYIQDQIRLVDDQIKEIDELKDRREKLVARMEAIQKLQGNRPVIVHLFDEFVKRLPDGVYFDKMERTGGTFRVSGVAESNNRISNLMRNLEESRWLSAPNLEKVGAAKNKSIEGNAFDMTVREEAGGDEGGESNGS